MDTLCERLAELTGQREDVAGTLADFLRRRPQCTGLPYLAWEAGLDGWVGCFWHR